MTFSPHFAFSSSRFQPFPFSWFFPICLFLRGLRPFFLADPLYLIQSLPLLEKGVSPSSIFSLPCSPPYFLSSCSASLPLPNYIPLFVPFAAPHLSLSAPSPFLSVFVLTLSHSPFLLILETVHWYKFREFFLSSLERGLGAKIYFD